MGLQRDSLKHQDLFDFSFIVLAPETISKRVAAAASSAPPTLTVTAPILQQTIVPGETPISVTWTSTNLPAGSLVKAELWMSVYGPDKSSGVIAENFDAAAGEVSWTPPANLQAATYYVIVTVTDATGAKIASSTGAKFPVVLKGGFRPVRGKSLPHAELFFPDPVPKEPSPESSSEPTSDVAAAAEPASTSSAPAEAVVSSAPATTLAPAASTPAPSSAMPATPQAAAAPSKPAAAPSQPAAAASAQPAGTTKSSATTGAAPIATASAAVAFGASTVGSEADKALATSTTQMSEIPLEELGNETNMFEVVSSSSSDVAFFALLFAS